MVQFLGMFAPVQSEQNGAHKMLKHVKLSQGITRTVDNYYNWVRVPDDTDGHDEMLRTQVITYYRNDTDDIITEFETITRVNPISLTPWHY